MTPKPLVSVVIPSHNRPIHILTAVNSVLKQSYQNVEVIVVDDGSKEAVQLPFEDHRVRIIRNEIAGGVAAARNQGFAAAKGEYLCLLDDDDYYYPHKIERQLAWLQSHPETDMVVSQVEYVYQDGHRQCYEHSIHWFNNFKEFNTIHTNASLFHRRVLERVRFDERMNKYTDTQFYLAACLQCKVDYLPGAVAVWNVDLCPLRITRPRDYEKNYRNFKLLCENFREVIESSAVLRYRYYRRVVLYAAASFNFADALLYSVKLLWSRDHKHAHTFSTAT